MNSRWTYPGRGGSTGTEAMKFILVTAPLRLKVRGFGSLRTCRRGFTLVEVLVAVAVLSIGLVAVVGSYSRSLDAMGTAVSAADATAALEEVIWLVKASPEKYLRQGEGHVQGYGGGLYWKVESRPEPQGVRRGDPLQHVWISVRWREGETWRSIGASTLLWSPTAPQEDATQ